MTHFEIPDLKSLDPVVSSSPRAAAVSVRSHSAGMMAQADAATSSLPGADADSLNPVAPKKPHHPATAKRVIFLFMEGGPSHIDLFDPKPLLNELAGQTIPDSFAEVITAMGEMKSPLLACKRKWKQHGEGGLWISDWLPNIAECADDLAVIRSCVANGINHSAGVCQMNTCSILSGRPSLGGWVSYGLGSENENLPSFVVMQDNPSSVVNGPRNWGAGFMPAAYQGVRLSEGTQPISYLNSPEGYTSKRQLSKLDFLNRLNRGYADQHPEQSELEARIASYELAFRMQSEAPEAIDLSDETEETLEMYGINDKATAKYGRLCLLGRRLAERDVRFIQLYSGAGSKWDSHDNLDKKHAGDVPKHGQTRCRFVERSQTARDARGHLSGLGR